MELNNGLIAPSLLSADFSCLFKDIADVEPLADLWHVDVMDGHFVPNITIGPFIVKAINKITDVPLDVHLMIENPNRYANAFLDAGARFLTAHIEAFSSQDEVKEFISIVKSKGAKAGLSIKPATEVAELMPFLSDLDMILVMSVEPGFGGQEFMPVAVEKIREIRKVFEGMISVDGGINAESARLTAKAGVDILVAGSFIFRAEDRVKAIKSLRSAFEII